MKRPLSVLFLFCNIFYGFAQNYTATYELTFKSDSTNRANERREIFRLMLGADKSYFKSDAKFVSDSTIAAFGAKPGSENDIAGALALVPKLPKTAFGETIVKDTKAATLTFYGSVAMSKLAYDEKPEFNWKISDEKRKIGPLECQKATTDFGGRKWTAWFAPEIQFQDGPYKFSGLPGLIVDISDEKADYHYLMLRLSKSGAPVQADFSRYTKTTKQKYYKAYEEFRENPTAMINHSMQAMGATASGSNVQVNAVRERWQKRNNPMELSAAK